MFHLTHMKAYSGQILAYQILVLTANAKLMSTRTSVFAILDLAVTVVNLVIA